MPYCGPAYAWWPCVQAAGVKTPVELLLLRADKTEQASACDRRVQAQRAAMPHLMPRLQVRPKAVQAGTVVQAGSLWQQGFVLQAGQVQRPDVDGTQRVLQRGSGLHRDSFWVVHRRCAGWRGQHWVCLDSCACSHQSSP